MSDTKEVSLMEGAEGFTRRWPAGKEEMHRGGGGMKRAKEVEELEEADEM